MIKRQSRRAFFKNGLVVTGALYPLGKANAFDRFSDESCIEGSDGTGINPDIIQTLKAGIDASLAAGASYADCRFTHTIIRDIRVGPKGIMTTASSDTESVTVGIRSLVKGYWGFAAGTLWDKNEMIRLARESVSLASGGAVTGLREVVLVDRDIVTDGSWATPIEIDPFKIHPAEISDRIGGLRVFASNMAMTQVVGTTTQFIQQNKYFIASDGCSFKQTTYNSSGLFTLMVSDGPRRVQGNISSLSPAGIGFELFDEARLREEIVQLREDLKEDLKLPVKPVEVGRYETLVNAEAVASVLSSTIGAATEIDRVMGHEANATGTSYLKDPNADLGNFIVGNEMLNIMADRNAKGSVATVKWDDEGVATQRFSLVEKGVIKDFQTNREGVEWIRKGYKSNNIPLSSRGCAYATEAVDPVSVHTANMTMKPGSGNDSTASLMNNIKDGIYIPSWFATPDYQQLGVFAVAPRCYEIKQGKKAAFLINAGTLFRTPEFWKSISGIGGESSTEKFGLAERKGQPEQNSHHSITSVPVVLKDLSLIDIKRKA